MEIRAIQKKARSAKAGTVPETAAMADDYSADAERVDVSEGD